jgi:hypothetical protein
MNGSQGPQLAFSFQSSESWSNGQIFGYSPHASTVRGCRSVGLYRKALHVTKKKTIRSFYALLTGTRQVCEPRDSGGIPGLNRGLSYNAKGTTVLDG